MPQDYSDDNPVNLINLRNLTARNKHFPISKCAAESLFFTRVIEKCLEIKKT